MTDPTAPPEGGSPWGTALSLLITGTALATHTLWLPELQRAWYGDERSHSSGCQHVHQQAQVALEPEAQPVRTPRALPKRPTLNSPDMPRLPVAPNALSDQWQLALVLPTPRFEHPTFEYGLATRR